MRILFSEAKPDYRHYIFPYAVWAIPDPHENPADLFNAGFLPASRDMDRYYLCRHVRVDLSQFHATSENRRILRKGHGIKLHLVSRSTFHYGEEHRIAWKHYSDIRFGQDVMSLQRLDKLMGSRLVTDVMVFTDEATDREVGHVTLFLKPPKLAYYYYSFYDLNYYGRNLGMFMMTSAVDHFANLGIEFLYLGTVYSKSALYKTQFPGAQCFNGFEWSDQIPQLKHLLDRDNRVLDHHLLESELFVKAFYPKGLKAIIADNGFQVDLFPSESRHANNQLKTSPPSQT